MRLTPRTALVEFEAGHEYEGLWLRLRLDVPMALLFRLQGLGTVAGPEAQEILQLFGARVLVEWNLEDDDGPVPANGEGFLRQPFAFAATIIARWSAAATEVPGPLDGRLLAGVP